jgi:hypothetical protein
MTCTGELFCVVSQLLKTPTVTFFPLCCGRFDFETGQSAWVES